MAKSMVSYLRSKIGVTKSAGVTTTGPNYGKAHPTVAVAGPIKKQTEKKLATKKLTKVPAKTDGKNKPMQGQVKKAVSTKNNKESRRSDRINYKSIKGMK